MKYTLIVLSIAIASVSCNKKQLPESKYVYLDTYEYVADRCIDTTRHISTGELTYNTPVRKGSTLFMYNNTVDIQNADDAAVSSTVQFQADSGVTSFSYTNEEMAAHFTHYSTGGAWSFSGYTLLNKGNISGVKQQDGTWKVSIHVALPRRDEVTNKDVINDDVLFKQSQY